MIIQFGQIVGCNCKECNCCLGIIFQIFVEVKGQYCCFGQYGFKNDLYRWVDEFKNQQCCFNDFYDIIDRVQFFMEVYNQEGGENECRISIWLQQDQENGQCDKFEGGQLCFRLLEVCVVGVQKCRNVQVGVYFSQFGRLKRKIIERKLGGCFFDIGFENQDEDQYQYR